MVLAYTAHATLSRRGILSGIMGETSPISLALVLLAAFWSGTSAVFTGIKETNEIRDQILSGKIGERVLSTEERWHSFWWDWAPMKLSLSAISGVLCAVILFLPKLQGGYGTPFSDVCIIAASMPVLGCVFQLIVFFVAALFLRKRIKADSQSQ